MLLREMERSNGSLLKKSDIDVLNVGKGFLEERDSVSTANRQWMRIDLGGCRSTNPHWAGPNNWMNPTGRVPLVPQPL